MERLEETEPVYQALEDTYALAVTLQFDESDGLLEENTPVDDWDAFGHEYVESFFAEENVIAYFTPDQLNELENSTRKSSLGPRVLWPGRRDNS